jgi:hypothetical protein
VWLRTAPASLPQLEVTHGQVTLYNAVHIAGLAGIAEHADRFRVPPTEILELTDENGPILQDGETLWHSDPDLVYARVTLPDIEIHKSTSTARALVEGLIAVNHAIDDTWKVLPGSLVFIDGECASLLGWADEDPPPMYLASNDRTGRDIEVMALNERSLDAQKLQDLQDAISMSTTLKMATTEGPQAVVMTAVRAIEHVSTWTTGGVDNWVDFASHYLKKAQCRGWLIGMLDFYPMQAIHSIGDLRADKDAQRELSAIESEIRQYVFPHHQIDRRVAAKSVKALHRIFSDHWLSRGLGELDSSLSTPADIKKKLDGYGRKFDRQVRRLKRLRNAAIHGGPVSTAACESVAGFAAGLGHRSLNEAMAALLTGRDIESHLVSYRHASLARHELVCSNGTVDDLFVPDNVDPGEG